MENLIVPPRSLASSLGTMYVTNVNSKNGALVISGGSGISIDNTGLSTITVNVSNSVVQNNVATTFSARATFSEISIPLALPGSPVNGDMYYDVATSSLKLYNSGWIVISPTGASIGETIGNSPNTKSILYVGSSGVLAQSTTFVVDNSSGIKVGIGQSSPTQALEVVGTIKGTALLITGLGTAVTPNANIITSDTNGNLVASTPASVVGAVGVLKGANSGALSVTATTLNLSTGSQGIFVDNSGKVGIGTVSPTQPLTVAGQIQANNVIINSIPSAVIGDDLVISGTSKTINCKSQLDFATNITATLTTSNSVVDPTGRVVIKITTGSPWLSTDRMTLTGSTGRHTQILVLQWVNSSGALNPILSTSSNVKLTADWQPTLNDTLTLMNISTTLNTAGVWYEISRTALPS
jgi:hypothetical protein